MPVTHFPTPLEKIVIANDTLSVCHDVGCGTVTVADRATGRVFATIDVGTAAALGERFAVTSAVFGDGERVVIPVAGEKGPSLDVWVFPDLPFALFSRKIANGWEEPVVVNQVPLPGFSLELGCPASHARTLGTGGLTTPSDNPGSYAWRAVADPETRAGVVAGWLTHDRASGVLFSSLVDGAIQIDARGEYGCLRLAPGEKTDSETFAIGYFADARLGLEEWADAVARVHEIVLPPQPGGFCTWYTEKHGGASGEKHLAELVAFVQTNLQPFGFDCVQIDDGWQLGDAKGNGPNKNFTSFNPKGPYPSGMKAVAARVSEAGLLPGIWFMPFAGTYDDPYFAGRQDWFVKRADGTPYDTVWGGTSIDMTHPAARLALRKYIANFVNEWGFRYFKMDGLYTGLAARQVYVNTGYVDDGFGDAVFSVTTKTNIEVFRDGLKLVRDAAGAHVFLLGCTVAQNMRSYGASFGLVDAMRIGADNSGDWNAWVAVSPVAGSRNYFLHGRVWYNDPDPFYVRAGVSLAEARTMASWTAITGQLCVNSDWILDLAPDRLDILRRVFPAHGRAARPVDLFENDPPRVWTVTDETGSVRRDLVALFNWTDQDLPFNIPLANLDLPKAAEFGVFDGWAGTLLPTVREGIRTTIPPHGCRILALCPVRDHPVLISTSRHVTQGVVDVHDERWDENTLTLAGSSTVVAGDRYEMRIVLPTGRSLKATTAACTGNDFGLDFEVLVRTEGDLVRASFTPGESGIVDWVVEFVAVGA